MQHDVGEHAPLVIETDPMADTFMSTMVDDTVIARLLSMRCQEAQEQSLPNQDFAQAICQGRSSLSFCVCDGVGSSYRGDYAARYLALCLVQWLQGLTELQQEPAQLAAVLQSYLNQCA